MHELLQQAVAPPVEVAIGGQKYTLAYPMAAVILYKQKTGDNLFDVATWDKADLAGDPERFLTLLWAGLHTVKEKQFVPAISYDELAQQVDYGPPAGELAIAMWAALTRFMPKKKADSDPNAAAPAIEAPPAASSSGEMVTTTTTSFSLCGSPLVTSELLTTNS